MRSPKATSAAARPEMDRVIAGLDPAAGTGTPLVGGGLPGLEYRVSLSNGLRSRNLVFFDGASEYTINCQYTQFRRMEIAAACESVRSTLRRLAP